MPTVSVVVPNYNHARFLPRRIDSILQQTFQDFELILLDDCSSDESRSILSGYAFDSRVRIEFNETNSGSTFKQWNKGAGLARGDYLWFAESDDYADPRMLEKLLVLLQDNPRCSFAYCRSWKVGVDEEVLGLTESQTDDPDPERWAADHTVHGYDECRNFLIFRNTVPNASAVIFRRAAYEKVGGADERLRLCGDWKLWSSMALTGDISYLAEPLNYFRYHPDAVRFTAGSKILMSEECLHVVQWMLERVSFEDMEGLRSRIAGLWLPGLIGTHVPLERGRAILREAKTLDPHAFRRFVCAWTLHTLLPILNLTRPVRHAMGLDQNALRRLRSMFERQPENASQEHTRR